MARIRGPLSPHLQIYRPQLTSVLSITHRATGVFLAAGALLLCYWLLCVAAGAPSYDRLVAIFGTLPGRVLLLAIVLSFYFHLCNGIRHLFWDAGLGLELRTTYRSGYTVLAASLALTAATCWAACVA
jgi:succinate dehydrogenase / fumarate reductase cytochrome b subunit